MGESDSEEHMSLRVDIRGYQWALTCQTRRNGRSKKWVVIVVVLVIIVDVMSNRCVCCQFIPASALTLFKHLQGIWVMNIGLLVLALDHYTLIWTLSRVGIISPSFYSHITYTLAFILPHLAFLCADTHRFSFACDHHTPSYLYRKSKFRV